MCSEMANAHHRPIHSTVLTIDGDSIGRKNQSQAHFALPPSNNYWKLSANKEAIKHIKRNKAESAITKDENRVDRELAERDRRGRDKVNQFMFKRAWMCGCRSKSENHWKSIGDENGFLCKRKGFSFSANCISVIRGKLSGCGRICRLLAVVERDWYEQ